MAENTRKVLINRHSPRPVAPSPDSMYHGEIAVSHPAENLSATTIYTKNGNVMVPFASCAMTMTMIDNAIDAANVTYDVKAADKDAHIEVASGGTGQAKVFTVSSKDVQSKKEFDAYSAATKTRIDNITSAVDSLINDVVTGITGDGVVIATKVENGTGSNSYNLTHKTGLETSDFNKLATDAYGHVTGATPVEANDIKKLGFENSAWTEEQINSAIEALDKTDDVAVEGQYVAAIEETNGVVAVKTRANVSEAVLNNYAKGTDAAAVVASDSINVAIGKLENQIDKAKAAATTKVAKDNAASHLTLTSSTADDGSMTYTIGESDIASKTALDALSGVVETFSGATETKIASAFTYVNDKINALDVPKVSAEGQAITAISQTDGKISAVAGDIAAAHVTVADAGGNLTAATVEAALAELADKAKAITITNADKSINVVSSATGTDINVNIKSGEKVLAKDVNGGLYTDIKICGVTPTSTTIKEEYVLYATDGTILGDHIKIYKDSHIKSIEYITTPGDEHYQNLKYTYIDDKEQEQAVYVDMSSLVLEAEFASGVTADESGVVHGVVDSAGEKFLTVGADGFKLSGVQAAIDTAKAAATTKVVEGTDTGNNLEIVSNGNGDGSVTYTVNLTDVASKNALDAEIAARKAVDGQDGETYAENTSANYISAATSLNDADVKLDAAIKAVSVKVDTAIADLDSNSATTDSGHYITAITITDGKISAVGQSDKVNSASTAAHADAAAKVDQKLTFSDVATKVEYDGSEAKAITFGSPVNATDITGRSLSITNGVVDVEIIDCGTY